MMFASTEEVNKIRERFECYVSRLENEKFESDYDKIVKEYDVYCEGKKLDEIEEKVLAVISSNGLLNYLKETQKIELEHS